MLFAVWAFCLMCQTFILKLEFLFQKAVAGFTLGVLFFFTFFCINPFHFLYKKGRVALAQTLWNIIISPFGLTRFRHFFIADIFCSLVQPLKDLGFIGCFFTQGNWLDSTAPTLDKCPQLENYLLGIAFLPYWFRLAQCFRRYHEQKMKVHLVNAGKYFSVILIQFANIFKHKIRGDLTLTCFIVISVISTLYAFTWDLYMDWGLIRSKEKGRYMLRHKVLLPKWFYYYAIVTNLILRFAWIALLYTAYMPQWLNSSQALIMVLCLSEGYRRA